MNFSDDPVVHWLMRTSLEGGLLIVLALALRRAFPRLLTPGWRVVLWAVVGVKLAVPASLPIGVGFGEVTVVEPMESGRHRPADETGGEGAPTPWVAPARVSASSIVLGVWGVGIGSVLALLAIREARFRRSLAGLPRCEDRELLALVRECSAGCPPEVRLLAAGSGPAIAGLFTPVLLLPADWRARFDRDSLRHVIFHELEHVRSHDLVWNWIAALVTAVHWPNPLVWLAASRFQSDRELRCDARALDRMAPAERVAYGRTLLRISETFLAPPATAGLAPCVRNHPSLRHRITMITRPPTSSPVLHALSAGALGLLVCLSFGSARAQEERGKEPAAEEKPVIRDGEKPREGVRDGDRRKEGARDGGTPRTGPRDGEVRRSGPRDGEVPRTGPRDEGGRKPEGERPRRQSAEGRERGAERESGEPIVIHVMGQGDDVKIAGETVPVNRLRGFLQGYLADKKDRPVSIDADPATPFSAVAAVLDAARDNGAKRAQIRAR